MGEAIKSVELEVMPDTDKGTVPELKTVKVKFFELPTYT